MAIYYVIAFAFVVVLLELRHSAKKERKKLQEEQQKKREEQRRKEIEAKARKEARWRKEEAKWYLQIERAYRMDAEYRRKLQAQQAEQDAKAQDPLTRFSLIDTEAE